jgi:hypothetical protein
MNSQPELRPIPGTEGYKITKDGRLWIEPKVRPSFEVNRHQREGGWAAVQKRDKGKFLYYNLIIHGRKAQKCAHDLVLAAWGEEYAKLIPRPQRRSTTKDIVADPNL